MSSLIQDYEYDIFISYRHKDNKYDGWVTAFVENLKRELESTFKEDVTIYFDENAHDGLHDTHDVDDSLKHKIECLVFIPIVSRTYCDPNSFAWKKELLGFRDFTLNDSFGLKVKLSNGNVSSRILPVRIHDVDSDDLKLFEKETGSVIRPVDFIFKSTGVSRPLTNADERKDNQHHTLYRDQINKLAMSVREIITALKQPKAKADISRTATPIIKSQTSGSGKKVIISLLVLILLCLAGAGVMYLIKNNASFAQSTSEEEIERSIAVLPFADMSEGKDQEYFSDGLSEELLNVLAKIPDLKVISRTSAFSFKGKNEDIRSIGDQLEVAYLLEGSVRKSQDKVRITAQLIKASDGAHLWSETFDRNLNDIFEVQEEIANAVVNQLKIKLLGNNRKQRESNPEVYNLWLQAKFFLNLVTQENTKKAFGFLEQAYKLDSTDARVWAGLAIANFNLLGDAQILEETRGLAAKAEEAARKALSFDSNLPEAYVVLAEIAIINWDLKNAEKYMHTALELDPANAFSIMTLGSVVRDLGRYEEAHKLYAKSIEHDPLMPTCFSRMSVIMALMGRHEVALEQINKALAITSRPIYYCIQSNIYLFLNEPDKALKSAGHSEDEFWRLHAEILALWSLDRKPEANKMLNKFIKDFSDVGAFQVAEIYAWFGDQDKAFEWLDIAYVQRDQGLVEIKSSLFIKSLIHDKRYARMMTKLNLPL